jgi:hypothetical protein
LKIVRLYIDGDAVEPDPSDDIDLKGGWSCGFEAGVSRK